jgi:hypothetical protein
VKGKRELRQALESLSPDLLASLQTFVENHRPRAKVFNGPRPRMESVRYARQWLEHAVQTNKPGPPRSGA